MQFELETVVPGKGGCVKVLKGEFCGEVGSIYEKDAEKGVVYVQLEDFEIRTMDFDDVAQFRGE